MPNPVLAARNPTLLSSAETARLIGCGPDTVRRLVREGELKAIRFTPKGVLRFRPDDVADLIERARDGV
jgi:excisionase family DNA binding protein